jgi:uncharacterized membrane protein
MRDQGKIVGALLVGLGLGYLLDPDRGARRRALMRDRATRAGHRLADGLDAAARDLRNRAGGAAAEARARLREEEVDDVILHERVRSAIGHAVSHPGAVEVTATEGRVTLQGHVLEDELAGLLAAAKRVRGVVEVVNELEAHRTAEGSPSLQGEGRRPGGRFAAGTVGAGLLSRARGLFAAGRSTRGEGGGRSWSIEVEKTLNVDASIELVWDLWSKFENFPRFMSHLREVRRTGEDRSHWVAEGPGGAPVSWDAVTTEWVPNDRIGWRSIEGSAVENEGMVQFRRNPDGGTRIDVRMSYNPPGGPAGHAVASLFGVDPKEAMDEDMVRLKSLLEDGKTSTAEGRLALDQVSSGRGRGAEAGG